MIVSSLRGGLGNQMFIYAMVKAMALRNNVPFAFNLTTDFANDEVYKRKLLLSYFALDLPENKKLSDYPFMHLLYSQLLVCQRVCLQNTVCLICK